MLYPIFLGLADLPNCCYIIESLNPPNDTPQMQPVQNSIELKTARKRSQLSLPKTRVLSPKSFHWGHFLLRFLGHCVFKRKPKETHGFGCLKIGIGFLFRMAKRVPKGHQPFVLGRKRSQNKTTSKPKGVLEMNPKVIQATWRLRPFGSTGSTPSRRETSRVASLSFTSTLPTAELQRSKLLRLAECAEMDGRPFAEMSCVCLKKRKTKPCWS